MAFSYTRIMDATGSRMAYGTFNAASVTGGDIDTGMTRVYSFQTTIIGSTANKAAVVNETIAADGTIPGNAVTIVCDSGATGSWWAIGD